MIRTPDTLFLPNTSSYLFLSRLNSVKCVRGRLQHPAKSLGNCHREKRKKKKKINVIDSSSTDRGGRYRTVTTTEPIPGECEPMRTEKSKPPTETLVFFFFHFSSRKCPAFLRKVLSFYQREKKGKTTPKTVVENKNSDSIIIKRNRKGSNTTP